MYWKYIVFLFMLFYVKVNGQFIPKHHSHNSIYEFIDELASEKIVSINSFIKPYSQKEIREWLESANQKKEILNNRQQKDLDFYLRIYSFGLNGVNNYKKNAKLDFFKNSEKFSTGINPWGLFWSDSCVNIAIKPIWGVRYALNEKGNVHHTWGGAEATLVVGKWGMYANLRENNMAEPFSLPSYLVKAEGGNYKIGAEGIDASTYSEMRGGITFNWNWGAVGFAKDHVVWGENYNGSNIFSGRTPSFPMLTFKMEPVKWFSFNYYHGWLVSQVIDSTRSYITSNGDFRAIYRNKYIAANMYTIKPTNHFSFSFGNSIVYSDENVKAAYLIPFLFYKSVDHTVNYGVDNQNSQIFGSISIRSIKKVHFYGNIYIDDFSILRVFDSERQNFVGYKSGIRISNWPFQNIFFTAEYTKSNPIIYKHRVETLSFKSNNFNLGHYLSDNSREYYFDFSIKPFRGCQFKLSYLHAAHGNEYEYTNGYEAELLPFMENVTWLNKSFSVSFIYEFFSEAYLYINFINSNIQGFDIDGRDAQFYMNLYTPNFIHGVNNTFTLGFNFGF